MLLWIFFFISSSGGARCFCEDAGLLWIFHQPVQYRSSTSLSYISYNIKDGSQISFWEDVWRGNRAFSEWFPNLYHVVFNKHDTVEQVVSTNPLNLSFWRTLVDVKLNEYINLVAYLRDFNLTDERDTISWKLHNNGQFSVHSMYQELINQ